MKISLGMDLQDGPFGGGNQFGHALVKYLQERDVIVTHNLADPDLDIILLAEPRSGLRISAYTDKQIFAYLRKYPRTLVVHRINECDERKATSTVNAILRRANLCADHTVFVSAWLRDLHLSQGMAAQANTVILNGADRTIFHADGYVRWDGQTPLKLVTHHWGGHHLKGFDIYEQIDALCGMPENKDKYSFTYIGNLPDGFSFKNSQCIQPLNGHQLADAIRQHHVYVTASRFEPGPNHQNEGASCGLPLLYINSGGLTEYCRGYGVEFTVDNFVDKLHEMTDKYDYWADRIADYPYHAEKTVQSYYDLFVELLSRRDTIVRQRNPIRRMRWLWLKALARLL